MRRPSIYLSNWSSPTHHGPGRKLSGMALPRAWERGDGRVRMVAPDPDLLRAVKAGTLPIRDYLRAYEKRIAPLDLHPEKLVLEDGSPVLDGDSVLCACAARRPDPLATRHPCHLEVLAPRLATSGWRVVLYREVLEVLDGKVWRGSQLYSWDPFLLHPTPPQG